MKKMLLGAVALAAMTFMPAAARAGGHGHSSFGVSIGFSSGGYCGNGVSYGGYYNYNHGGYGYGRGGYCGPSYYRSYQPYCAPVYRPVCAPVYRPYCAPTVVYTAPPVVYSAPPVVYSPAPVVYSPSPVVYSSTPVTYAPQPASATASTYYYGGAAYYGK
jgi:hypothetical protein